MALEIIRAGRIMQLLFLLAILTIVFYCKSKQKKGILPTIRKIAGLEALEESIGRAVELGKPVHFSPGWSNKGALLSNDAEQLIAGLNFLNYVSRLTASKGSKLIVTLNNAQLTPFATEIVQNSYKMENAIDQYDSNVVIDYISEEQLAYATKVITIMNREKISTNILIGPWYMVSLLLVEAGAEVGAMQIAGTASESQIPFFAASADYCLIGEEILAAGAYLSRDENQMSTLIGQDYSKMIILIMIILGIFVNMINPSWIKSVLSL